MKIHISVEIQKLTDKNVLLLVDAFKTLREAKKYQKDRMLIKLPKNVASQGFARRTVKLGK